MRVGEPWGMPISIMRDSQGSIVIIYYSEWYSTSKDVVSCCVDRNSILLLMPQVTMQPFPPYHSLLAFLLTTSLLTARNIHTVTCMYMYFGEQWES